MNKTNYILLSIIFFASFYLISNTLSYEAKTGDKVLDQKLKEINAKAITNIDEFKRFIALKYQISESDVSKLLKVLEPAEILFSYEISVINSTPHYLVIEKFRKNKSKGWQVVINQLGIKKNSEKFNELKNLSIYDIQKIDESSLSQNK
jgi:hypothetical protein